MQRVHRGGIDEPRRIDRLRSVAVEHHASSERYRYPVIQSRRHRSAEDHDVDGAALIGGEQETLEVVASKIERRIVCTVAGVRFVRRSGHELQAQGGCGIREPPCDVVTRGGDDQDAFACVPPVPSAARRH